MGLQKGTFRNKCISYECREIFYQLSIYRFFIDYFLKAQVKQNTWNQVSVVSLDFLTDTDSVK